MTTQILWFKNDLRVDDNPALAAAARADRLLCVYCIDTRHDALSEYGPVKLGPHRRGFLREALADLDATLRTRGNRLRILREPPHVALARLAEKHAVQTVHTTAEFAPEEIASVQRVAAALTSARLVQHEGGALYARSELPFKLENMPRVFTRFRKAVEQACTVQAPIDAPAELPESPSSDGGADALPNVAEWPSTQTPFTGGEAAGLARLDYYLWESRAVASYKQTRNGLLGMDYSTKFSPWLALGCLSPRRIVREIERFEQDIVANQSTYWVAFELHWREFFRWTLAKHGARLFALRGLLERDDRPAARDADIIAAWQAGRTGMPFVDANMRELSATGYMSGRGRQNAASFLARDLGQDWRVGAAWFEAQLIDYDVSSNWGNWANVAGVGTDKRDRGFDVLWQAQRYDLDAGFVSHWLPELETLPVERRHTPFLLDRPERRGLLYPDIIVDIPDAWHS